MTNDAIAERLRRHASELSRNGDNLYRVRAFRQAAVTVLTLPQPISEIVETRGRRGLEGIPGIGRSIAEAIDSLARTGEWAA